MCPSTEINPTIAFYIIACHAISLSFFGLFAILIVPPCAYYTPGNLKTTSLDIHKPEHKQKTKSNSAQY